MQNPFDKPTQPDSYIFFDQMTSAIDKWMLEKYPEFDQSLIKKMKDLEVYQNKVFTLFNTLSDKLKDEKNETLQYFKDEIDKFLSEKHPGTLSRLTNLADDLESQSKRLKEQDKEIKDKLKTLIQSDSLFKDVYIMRDEMKILKDEWESLAKKMKNLFK